MEGFEKCLWCFDIEEHKCYFFSNEGNPLEPLHIHVRKGEATAKFWIEPIVAVDLSYQMTSSELKELAKVVQLNATKIERKWNEFFGQ